MTAKPVVCPICGNSDDISKVSTIYLTGIGLRRLRGSGRNLGDQPEPGPKIAARPGLSAYAHSRRFAPPSSGRQMPTRPIHPDMIIVVFSAVAPLFLYGILTTQSGMLLPVLVFLGGFYAVYFWQRKKIIKKFEDEQNRRKAVDNRINRGISRWMKLYYCPREDIVFEPRTDKVIPLDQMTGYLLGEE